MGSFYWTTNQKEAEREQLALKELIEMRTSLSKDLNYAKGLAIGTSYEENTGVAFALGVEFNWNGTYINEKKILAQEEVNFPYVPGLLAFRVGPAICKMLDPIINEYDLLLFDGQGIAHPRGFGLATHIGVLYDKPTIGLTRKRLFGKCIDPPKGKFSSPITHPKSDQLIGYALSNKKSNESFYFSPGHKISAPDSLEIVRQLYKDDNSDFPSPIRIAHNQANRISKKHWQEIRKSKFNLN